MEEIVNKAEPRENAINVIRNLRKEGHKIYIITARDNEFHDDPYILSKTWLDKNKIEYDKLIVNARKKAQVCKQENIDLFIDDQLHNCIDIMTEGIQAIRITDNKEYFESKSRSIIEETGRILDEDFNTDGLRFIDGYKGRGYALSSDYSLNRTR